MSNFLKILLFSSIGGLIVGCGTGQQDSGGVKYYSAANDTYYQIESSTTGESSVLSITTNGIVTQIPLTPSINGGFVYNTLYKGQNAAGSVLVNNGNMGFTINSTGGSYFDFASQYVNNNSIPSGTYTTVCDTNNISPCVINIANNSISITEYGQSGVPVSLCTNQPLTLISANSPNPYLFYFSCGVEGGATSGKWYIAPLTINNITGFMISEFNPAINANDDGTDELAFPQSSFNPSGTYNYVSYGISTGVASLSSASFSNGSLNNPTIGSCAGAACAIVPNAFYNFPMVGFSYFSVNGTVNYNLVGSAGMGLYQDSYQGIYY